MSLRQLVFAGALIAGAVQPCAARQADAEAKEIASYRLTKPNLDKVINVNRALVQQLLADPKAREAIKIETEIDALEKKDSLTEAEEKRLEALRERQEQLENEDDNPLGGDARSLSEMEARIKRYAPMMAALQKEAMAPREYAKFWLAFVQAAFAQGFKKAGLLKELPPDVNPDNVKFVEDHADEIEAMQREIEALGRKK